MVSKLTQEKKYLQDLNKEFKNMKYNKRKLGIRLICFVPFLIYSFTGDIVISIMRSFQWLRFGGQTVIYAEDTRTQIGDLINNTKELVQLLKENK